MRVLIDGMPISVGGIGTLLINIVQYNKYIGNEKKYIFDFLLPEGSEYKKLLQQYNYVFYEVPRIFDIKYVSIIKNILSKNAYDYLWINNTSKVNIFLPHIAKKNDIMIISHSHGIKNEETGIKKIIFDIMETCFGKYYCNLIDIPFACSMESAKYFYPEKLYKKCKVIHNGIWSDQFKYNENARIEMRKKMEIDEEDVLLGAVGRLTRVKNFSFLFPIMKKLPDKYKLIILGNGEEKDKLQHDIQDNELEKRVSLLGEKEHIEQYLSAMDIFLMPSLNEGLPFALVEAQASGLTCIVSKGVTQESNLTGTVRYLGLLEQEQWIKEIMDLNSKRSSRTQGAEMIKNSGYDIGQSYRIFLNALENKEE